MIREDDQRYSDMPVNQRLPCANCRHLVPTEYEAYADCNYVAPVLAYWQHPPQGQVKWRNRKYIRGPFTTDAKEVECPAFEAVAYQESPASPPS